MSGTAASIVAVHRAGTCSPEDTVAQCYARIRAHDDPAIFISLRDQADAIADAKALAAEPHADRPLYGVPVAVKDNIDVKGLPTTAACPAFAYRPSKDATCVARLKRAGAIVIGKTNLDQFATGLVGVRSPYGVPRNLFDPALIPGGSSSGSGVAVGAGLVPLALGTDTAGSGRVPAAISNIVGLKPSLGLDLDRGRRACLPHARLRLGVLTHGGRCLHGACRDGRSGSGGCLFADPSAWACRWRSRRACGSAYRWRASGCSSAIRLRPANYEAALARFADLGAAIVEIDIEPFYETARLLYDGPWVAERYITARSLIASAPEAMHPVTRQIILSGARPTAVDAFVAFYNLEELRRIRDHTFRSIEVLVLPTIPTVYSVEEVLADPVQLNSRLGTYTNFVNLLDLCGLAVPASFRADGTPFGVTLLGLAGQDAMLASIGRVFHADTGLPMGATGKPQPPLCH